LKGYLYSPGPNCWDILHLDTVNPELLELQVAKRDLAELYNTQIWEADDLIQQRIVDFWLMGWNLTIIPHQECVSHSDCQIKN